MEWGTMRVLAPSALVEYLANGAPRDAKQRKCHSPVAAHRDPCLRLQPR